MEAGEADRTGGGGGSAAGCLAVATPQRPRGSGGGFLSSTAESAAARASLLQGCPPRGPVCPGAGAGFGAPGVVEQDGAGRSGLRTAGTVQAVGEPPRRSLVVGRTGPWDEPELAEEYPPGRGMVSVC